MQVSKGHCLFSFPAYVTHVYVEKEKEQNLTIANVT